MKSMTLRTAATIAAALVVGGCGELTRPLAPSAAPTTLDAGSAGGGTIAYEELVWSCGRDMMAGCDGDGPPGWNWSLVTFLATIGSDGANHARLVGLGEGATGVAPAWSRDGMRIAFQQYGDILVMAGGGGTPLNLTKHSAFDGSPTWSPDGGRIAFSSNRGGSPDLYVMSAVDGTSVTRLTSGVGFTGGPDWSPDGARIAFDCVVEAGNADVCTVNTDGTGFVRLTSAPGYDSGANWSAAGQIVFATDRYGAGSEIAVMRGDGSAVTRVASGVTGTKPVWSPDGSRIAFTRGADLYSSEIAVMAADGTNLGLLASMGSSPSWRPTDAAFPPVPPPVAKLGTPTCLELSCTFDGSGSTDEVGTTSLYYTWHFGDGTTAYYTSSPRHSYAKVGTYDVILQVGALATGKMSTATQSVTVTGLPIGAPPVASFTTRCVGLTCTLDGSGSTDDAAVLTYSWDLGKTPRETATGKVVTTDYPTEGSRTVVLTVTDGAGQTNSTSRTFTVAPIAGDAPPVARMTVSCAWLRCSYDFSASTDDNTILSYYFDPGLSSGSTKVQSTFGTLVYPTAGTYTMTLTVEDGVGQRSSASQAVTVAPEPPPNQPPTASFTHSCVRTKCTFDGRSSSDDQGIVSYNWNLGSASGSNVNGAVVTHDYRRTGSYTARLTVRDAAGQVGSVTRAITVAK